MPAHPAGPPPVSSGFLPDVIATIAGAVRAFVAGAQPQASAPGAPPPPGSPGAAPSAQPALATAPGQPGAAASAQTMPGQVATSAAAPLQQGTPVTHGAPIPGQLATPAALAAPATVAPSTTAAPPGQAPGTTHAAAPRADGQGVVPQRVDASVPPREPTLLDRLATLVRPTAGAPVNAPATPAAAGTTAAQAAAVAVPLAAVPASQAPFDARVATLPVLGDRGGVQRADAMMAGVYTADGPGRRRLRRSGNVLGGRMSDLLHGMRAGAAGRAGDGEAEVERIIANAMQWLFWVLAIVAYACLGLAMVALVPAGGELLGTQGRTWTGGFALGGLAVAAAAWLLARRLGRPRP